MFTRIAEIDLVVLGNHFVENLMSRDHCEME